MTEMLRLLPGEVGRNTVGDRNPRGVSGKRRWEVHIPVGSKVKSYISLDQMVTKDTSSPRRENFVAGQPMGP